MITHIRAPYRIFDCGGWSDNSFMPGGKGACCNIAVSLFVHVKYEANQSDTLTITHLANHKKETIKLPFTNTPTTLAEAAAAALPLTEKDGGDIRVESEVPHGSGLGGSATYSVALLGALRQDMMQDRHALAQLAQELETKWLKSSCGTQDQMAAAYGSISFSEVAYPAFTQETVVVPEGMRYELEESLLLVFTGESHFSAAMHATVVKELEADNKEVVAAFHTLKDCATEAHSALKQGDMAAYKFVLNKNWQAQKDLHPNITTEGIESLHKIILDWDPTAAFKGSGAGGGGSVAALVKPEQKEAIADAIRTHFPTMYVWEDLKIDTDGATPIQTA